MRIARVAPRLRRIPISRRRAVDFAVSRFAMFAQAISMTMPTTAINALS